MSEEELIKALRKYGDHKGDCGISRVINNPRAETNSDGHKVYPMCNCGWTALIQSIGAGAYLISK